MPPLKSMDHRYVYVEMDSKPLSLIIENNIWFTVHLELDNFMGYPTQSQLLKNTNGYNKEVYFKP